MLIMMAGLGGIIGVWAVSTLFFALSQNNWQVTELLRSYLVATGAIGEFQTLVDFYSYIKGVEYIICLAFLVAFPAFFKYINRPTEAVANR
ncbi:MAG TPA: hypothetical protein ENN98_02995 [Desulfurivibrio alkaliphilus]|uniref:Uncharacterized protein n=1 Tax=Desulfurivibrio alkaliphilus TaxID=427923 RepID=A0A7C2TG18_9BACT|nr:hypothetical protein [Desulfurivibrio alkaliphilus]